MAGTWPGQKAVYISSGRRAAATAWSAADSTVVPGSIRRQSGTPTLGNERFWVCYAPIGGGTNTGGADPLTTFTRGFIATDNTLIKWIEITGVAALNGDTTNTPLWTVSQTGVQPGLGQVVLDGAGHLFVCIASVGVTSTTPTWVTTSLGSQTTDAASNIWAYIGTSFTKWSAPHANMVNAQTTNWGDGAVTQFFVGDDHAESPTAQITFISRGTNAAPVDIICVSHTGSTPPVTADLATTGAISAVGGIGNTLYINGALRVVYGLTLDFGSAFGPVGQISNDNLDKNFESCKFHFTTTSAGSFGFVSAYARLLNCQFKFGSTGSWIATSGVIEMIGGSLDGAGSIPTSLIHCLGGFMLLRGVDLSAATGALVLGGANTTDVVFENCKLNAAATLLNLNSMGYRNNTVTVIESDSAGTNYVAAYADYTGTLTTTAPIMRTAGASNGVTGYSWKMVTTANINRGSDAFPSLPMSIWNPTGSGTVNVTAYGMAFTVAAPTTGDVFMEVDYLGASGSPISSHVTSAQDYLGTTSLSALSTDTSGWASAAAARVNANVTAIGDLQYVASAGSVNRVFICTAKTSDFKTAASLPGAYATAVDGDIITDGNTTWQAGWRFKIALATSPLMVGLLRAIVKVGTPSKTVFVDPLLTLS